MKTNYWKLAQVARWGFYILFGTLAILGIIAICLGYFQHIVTASGLRGNGLHDKETLVINF